MAQRFEEQVQLRFASPRTGAAEGLMGLSQKLARIRDQKLAEQKQRVIEEQTQAGLQAYQKGEKPTFADEDRLIGGVSAKAYNKGLRAAYLASLSNDVREDLANFEREHGADSAGYQNAVSAHRAALEQEVDPSVLPDVLSRYDQSATLGVNRVRDREYAQARKNQLSEFNASVDGLKNSAMIAARSQDMQQSAVLIQQASENIDNALDAELITKEQAAKSKRDVERLATEQGWVGWVEGVIDSDGTDAALKAVDDITTKPPTGFTQPEWDALRYDMQQTATRAASKERAKAKEGLSELRGRLKDYETGVSLGIEFDKAERDKLGIDVAAVADEHPELKKSFDIINQTGVYSLMSAKDRAGVLDKAKTGKIGDVDEYVSLVRAEQSIDAALKKDAVAFAGSQGIIDPVEWDFSTPDTIAAGVAQAEENSGEIRSHYGVSNPNFVSNVDLVQFDNFFADGMVEPGSRAMVAVKIGGESELWRQLDEKGSGALAAAASTGSADLATKYFVGQDRINIGEVKFQEGSATTPGWRTTADEYFDTGLAGAPRAKVNASKAALAVMAADTAEFDPALYEAALLRVAGAPYSRPDGSKYMTPPNVPEGAWDNYIDDFEPFLLEQYGDIKGFTHEQAAELIKDGNLIQVGSTEYQILGTNFTGSPAVLMGADGRPYTMVIDENAVRSAASVTDLARRQREADKAERFTRARRTKSTPDRMDRAGSAAQRYRQR